MKIDSLSRFLLPCLFPTTKNQDQDSPDSSTITTNTTIATMAPPRSSKSMVIGTKSTVIGTIFNYYGGRVWFYIQHHRRSIKPMLLLELSITFSQLAKEMRSGPVCITLESNLSSCPLLSVPAWTMYVNDKLGFAANQNPTHRMRRMLKKMKSVSVGTGILPNKFVSFNSAEAIHFMKAKYEHVVSSPDLESFHLIHPADREFSVLLVRSSKLRH